MWLLNLNTSYFIMSLIVRVGKWAVRSASQGVSLWMAVAVHTTVFLGPHSRTTSSHTETWCLKALKINVLVCAYHLWQIFSCASFPFCPPFVVMARDHTQTWLWCLLVGRLLVVVFSGVMLRCETIEVIGIFRQCIPGVRLLILPGSLSIIFRLLA